MNKYHFLKEYAKESYSTFHINVNLLYETIQDLSYEQLIDYERNLGDILYPPPQNRNDWQYHTFISADKRQIAKALYLTLKEV